MALPASFVVNAAGGAAYLAVGALLLLLKPARRGALGISLFALAAGLQHVFANVGELMLDVTPLVAMSRLPFLMIAPLPLVWGAAQFYGRGAWWAALPFIATSSCGAVALVFTPELVVAPTGFGRPLNDLLFTIPYFLAMATASGLILLRWTKESSAPLRHELVLILAALTPVLGYTSGYFGSRYGKDAREFQTVPYEVSMGYVVTFAICAAVVVTCAIVLLRRGDRGARILGAVSIGAVIVGLAHAAIVDSFAQLAGLLRIGAALLLGYALLRYRVFDIDVRVKTAVARALAAGLVVLGFFLGSEVAESLVASRTGSTLAGVATALAFLVVETRVMKAGRRIADRALPRVDASEASLSRRKAEIYRAAYESAARDGALTERERKLLATLSQELGLGPDEVAALHRLTAPRLPTASG